MATIKAKPEKKQEVRTNIVLRLDLVEKAKRKLHVRSAREAVNGALERLVNPRDYSGLLAMAGDAPVEGYEPKTGYAKKSARALRR